MGQASDGIGTRLPARLGRTLALASALLLPLLGALPTMAQPQSGPVRAAPMTQQERETEQRAAWMAAHELATQGPAMVPLSGQATLDLPGGMEFIPRDAAMRALRAGGNTPGPNLVGIINPLADTSPWFAVVSYDGGGHVSDSEADELDAAALLSALKEGVAEGNKDRVRRGFPEMELTGWSQPPAYDKAARRLTWALGYRMSDGDDSGLNFNTRILGREGYFSVNLLSSSDRLAQDRAEAAPAVAGLHYADGKRYEDYNPGTDKLAAVGLAGLIGVAAAKKLGFLALAGAFLLKFAKLGVVAVLGLGAAFAKLFRRTPRA